MPARYSHEKRKEYAESQPRDKDGHFISKNPNIPPLISDTETKDSIPPLVSLKVTNPITYLKLWWKKILGNEGIELKLKIRPLTAIVIVMLILGATFSFGWVTAVLSYIPVVRDVVPSSSRETAFAGILRYSSLTKKYYLVTQDSEAITLDVPESVHLSQLLSRRILATGKYNTQTKILTVIEASDMEILPSQVISLPSPMP